jgi:hypothetical protein
MNLFRRGVPAGEYRVDAADSGDVGIDRDLAQRPLALA